MYFYRSGCRISNQNGIQQKNHGNLIHISDVLSNNSSEDSESEKKNKETRFELFSLHFHPQLFQIVEDLKKKAVVEGPPAYSRSIVRESVTSNSFADFCAAAREKADQLKDADVKKGSVVLIYSFLIDM